MIAGLELSTVTKFLGEVNTCPLECGVNLVHISGLQLKVENRSEQPIVSKSEKDEAHYIHEEERGTGPFRVPEAISGHQRELL